MDKWKDLELAKMKAGGNKNAREFFESQADYNPSWSIHDKYNSKAAALLRDKVRGCYCYFEALRKCFYGVYLLSKLFLRL